MTVTRGTNQAFQYYVICYAKKKGSFRAFFLRTKEKEGCSELYNVH